VQDQPGALRREGPGDTGPNTAGRASDQHDFPAQESFHRPECLTENGDEGQARVARCRDSVRMSPCELD